MSAEALRGGGGADSFVQFPFKKGSRKVYNYSTRIFSERKRGKKIQRNDLSWGAEGCKINFASLAQRQSNGFAPIFSPT